MALESAKGVLRSTVGRQTGVRYTPSLTFIADVVPETAGRIEELLAKAREADAPVHAVAEAPRRRGTPTRTAAPRVADGRRGRGRVSEHRAAARRLGPRNRAAGGAPTRSSLACHVGPDGDALGSMLALGIALRAAGTRSSRPGAASRSRFPRRYAFLPGLDLLVPPRRVPAAPELLVTFDTGSADRLGRSPTG